MIDRELLELAAKAAGIRINHWVYDDLDYSPAVLEAGGTWHPLADDGDALRLAVKLGLYDLRDLPYQEGNDPVWQEVPDPCAATRRAITRAAAEIGRKTNHDRRIT